MGIGARVRRLFGRHERLVSELWRRAFIDLDELYGWVGRCVPAPRRILEIGCGEGAGTERLVALYPDARILAIDIAPNLGRLYNGSGENVFFERVPLDRLLPAHLGSFDLIIMCDVLHHIPPEVRPSILACVNALVAPGGSFVCKDWGRTRAPIHWLAYASDRWLTGDRINYLTRREAQQLFTEAMPDLTVQTQGTIGPWRNNYALRMVA